MEPVFANLLGEVSSDFVRDFCIMAAAVVLIFERGLNAWKGMRADPPNARQPDLAVLAKRLDDLTEQRAKDVAEVSDDCQEREHRFNEAMDAQYKQLDDKIDVIAQETAGLKEKVGLTHSSVIELNKTVNVLVKDIGQLQGARDQERRGAK